MKKLLLVVATLSFMAAAQSCKKCGHCQYPNGSNSSAVCNNSTLKMIGVDEYKEAQANCKADGGVWVKD